MGERQRRQAPVAGLRQDVGAGGDGPEVVVVEDGALGQSRRSAGPHDGHRVAWGAAPATGRAADPPAAARHAARASTVPAGPTGGSSPSSTIVTTGRERSRIDVDLGYAQAEVDARGDPPEPGDGRVADHVVDRAGQQEADHAARAHPVGVEESGHPVGGPVPRREGEGRPGPTAGRRLDVGLDVRVHPGGGAQDVDQRGVLPLDLTRRHIEGDCTSAAPGGIPSGCTRPLTGDPVGWRRRSVPRVVDCLRGPSLASSPVGGPTGGPGRGGSNHGVRRQRDRAPRPGGDAAARARR